MLVGGYLDGLLHKLYLAIKGKVKNLVNMPLNFFHPLLMIAERWN